MDALEHLVNESLDGGEVSAVIRPAVRLPEWEARAVLVELSLRDVRNGGHWHAEPARWTRYDQPWNRAGNAEQARLLGTMHVAYGTPTAYEITIYRVTITPAGTTAGMTVQGLCDEALGFVRLTLASCPRVDLMDPPEPFKF
jgi:hypothetical protein